jgi:succinyl-CoA synthetase beta subunit
MNIHEFQAKDLLRGYGLPLAPGGLARSAEEAESIARELRGSPCVIKAQILAGGRGKAGGIKTARSIAEAKDLAASLLGRTLVTAQTGPAGKAVKALYVEAAVERAREIYLAVLVDRSAGRVAFLGAAEGGEEIEEVAAQDPGKLHQLAVDPKAGLDAGEAHAFAARLGLESNAATEAAKIMDGLYRAFTELDASLIEINPLVLTADGALCALDVKMSFDDNALFRHPRIADLRDRDEDDPSEVEAARYEINYVRLDGDIGCMVNGAGLALATIDLLKEHGGRPADFMDLRPVVTRQQVATGFQMILRNPKVKAILVNMYGGGILRCDTIAEGIAGAVKESGLKVPLVVRAAGTNMEIARKILTSQAIPVAFADDMAGAAAQVVAAAKGQSGRGAA